MSANMTDRTGCADGGPRAAIERAANGQDAKLLIYPNGLEAHR
jgi:hypothetical protein